MPDPEGVAQTVSLLRGFNATIPSADKSRTRSRQTRNVEAPRLGLKRIGMQSRGMLGEEEEHDGESVDGEDDVVVVGSRGTTGKKGKGKKRSRPSLSASVMFGRDELVRQTQEIERDKEIFTFAGPS